jgi:hypothetical protein
MISTINMTTCVTISIYIKEEQELLRAQEREQKVQEEFQRDLERRRKEAALFAGKGSGVNSFFTNTNRPPATATASASLSNIKGPNKAIAGGIGFAADKDSIAESLVRVRMCSDCKMLLYIAMFFISV